MQRYKKQVTFYFSVITALALFVCSGTSVYATTQTYPSGTTTTTTLPVATSSAPNAGVTTGSGDETLGAVTFLPSNGNYVLVGGTLTLKISLTGMEAGTVTLFTVDFPEVAVIEKLDNTSVMLLGQEPGQVTVTASAGGRVAKQVVYVYAEEPNGGTAAQGGIAGSAETTAPPVNIVIDPAALNSFSAQYESDKTGDIIIGIIGLLIIVAGVGAVIAVILSGRRPKLLASPGTQRNYGIAGYAGKKKKRLLADHYYRNIKKY